MRKAKPYAELVFDSESRAEQPRLTTASCTPIVMIFALIPVGFSKTVGDIGKLQKRSIQNQDLIILRALCDPALQQGLGGTLDTGKGPASNGAS